MKGQQRELIDDWAAHFINQMAFVVGQAYQFDFLFKNGFFPFQSIVGKIEKIGIGNLMAGSGALGMPGGMYSRSSLTSPMAQLTCLFPSHSRDDLGTVHEKAEPSIEKLTAPGEFQVEMLIFVFCAS